MGVWGGRSESCYENKVYKCQQGRSVGLETENTGNHARDVSGWQKRQEHMAFELFKSSNKISCRLMVVYQCVCVGRGVTSCYLCF